MKELIARIKEIKIEKQEVVRSQRYEDAAKLRDKERKLLEELSKHEHFKDQYDIYIQNKIKEFDSLLIEKDGHYSIELFNFALKQLDEKFESSFTKTIEVEKAFIDMKNKATLPFHKENEEDTRFLNKWIIKNLISFETWFRNQYN